MPKVKQRPSIVRACAATMESPVRVRRQRKRKMRKASKLVYAGLGAYIEAVPRLARKSAQDLAACGIKVSYSTVSKKLKNEIVRVRKIPQRLRFKVEGITHPSKSTTDQHIVTVDRTTGLVYVKISSLGALASEGLKFRKRFKASKRLKVASVKLLKTESAKLVLAESFMHARNTHDDIHVDVSDERMESLRKLEPIVDPQTQDVMDMIESHNRQLLVD